MGVDCIWEFPLMIMILPASSEGRWWRGGQSPDWSAVPAGTPQLETPDPLEESWKYLFLRINCMRWKWPMVGDEPFDELTLFLALSDSTLLCHPQAHRTTTPIWSQVRADLSNGGTFTAPRRWSVLSAQRRTETTSPYSRSVRTVRTKSSSRRTRG